MVLAALKKKKPVKSIREQTPEEQMYLLKVGASNFRGKVDSLQKDQNGRQFRETF